MNRPARILMGTLVAVLVAALIAPIALLGIAIWSHDSSPVDLGKVYEVSQAGSAQEVEALLGRPQRVNKYAETGASSWTYSRSLLWHEFRVDFAPDGSVVRCVFQD